MTTDNIQAAQACPPMAAGEGESAVCRPEREAGSEQPSPGWAGFHKCPIECCRAMIHDAKLLCGLHWKMLPYGYALAIWKARKIGVDSPEHKAACAAAHTYVAEVDRQARPALAKLRAEAAE